MGNDGPSIRHTACRPSSDVFSTHLHQMMIPARIMTDLGLRSITFPTSSNPLLRFLVSRQLPSRPGSPTPSLRSPYAFRIRDQPAIIGANDGLVR